LKHLALAICAAAAFAGAAFGQPALDAQIADLKAKTSAMVAKQPRLQQTALDRSALIWRVPGAVVGLKDAPDAPEMVVIPAGEYTMGWKASDPQLFTGTPPIKPGLATRHRVRIAYPFAFSKYPVTVGEFAKFVAETGYDAGDVCQIDMSGMTKGKNWKSPGYIQTDDQPVVCINTADAQAYVTWLAKKTGKPYRLPNEAEYEYAERAGTTTYYWWGDEIGKGNGACNGCGSEWDGKVAPPVGKFKPNAFGLYDITGSVWSRTGDCWVDTFDAAPKDGGVNLIGACDQAVLRGGAFRTRAAHLRSAVRHQSAHANRYNDDGFHVVRTF
jgi:formylglycine-generating enzyme required for sulfatase activity